MQCDFDRVMIVGARQGGMSISKTADQQSLNFTENAVSSKNCNKIVSPNKTQIFKYKNINI